MRQKILPELFILHTKGKLPEQFQIIGVSRKAWSDADLKTYVREILADKNTGGDIDDYLARFTFVQGDVEDITDNVFEKLVPLVDEHSAVLYIALSPQLYKQAFTNLIASTLSHEDIRLCIEKPFGTSGEVARELNEILYRGFTEEQLYRVDHYLGKDSLVNATPIEMNGLEKITISFVQKEGVEKRALFYEATGALLDVGQNHMMEMFALTLGPTERAQVVGDLSLLSPEQVATQTIRSQWSGYRNIPGVAPNSTVETYFKIETSWRGIPTTFEGGKYMQEEKKEITFHYNDHVSVITIKNNKDEREHERLILACLRGQHEHFISSDEIAAQWRFVDPIKRAWESGVPPLSTY